MMTEQSPRPAGSPTAVEVLERGPIEVEAKLRVRDLATAAWLAESPRIAGCAATPIEAANLFEDHYLDTPDLALRSLGWTLRLRRLSRGTLASLKSIRAPEGAVHTRDEIEHLARFDPNPARWPESPVRARSLELLAGRRPEEIATVRQWRRNRHLHGPTGFHAELSLDEVEIIVGGEVVDRWTELELELLAGEAAMLEAIGERLTRRRGLAPERRSKGERALAIARGAAA